ncbi:MAG: hypothetical protein ACK5PY_00585, partial [bacterium]
PETSRTTADAASHGDNASLWFRPQTQRILAEFSVGATFILSQMGRNKASDEGVFVKKGLWAMRIQS